MLLRLHELDSRTSSIQQPPPQKPIPATPADGLEGDDEEDDSPPCKKALTGEKRVAERLVYSRFFNTTAAEPFSNGVAGLINALDDKRLEISLHQAAKARAAAQSKGSGSGGSEGGGGGNIRIKALVRAEHADQAANERADKNNDNDKFKGMPQPDKTTASQAEEQK
eukprot:jgi/Tetstr1/423998/TSEL_014609.t1